MSAAATSITTTVISAVVRQKVSPQARAPALKSPKIPSAQGVTQHHSATYPLSETPLLLLKTLGQALPVLPVVLEYHPLYHLL
jgi:hypothetical protein